MNNLEIIKKWYKILNFPTKYDNEFYDCLETIDVSDLTTFKNYDYKNNSPKKNLLSCLYFCEDLEKEYEKRGIPKQILFDSLKDLVLWTKSYFDMNNEIGLTEFPWIDRTFLLQIFRLGRLQFSMFPCEFDIAKISVKLNDPVLETHIPSGEPLDYYECEKSFKLAKEFFKKYFPSYPQEWLICHSWLLDDGLEEILQKDSNIIKFQKFFTPIQKDKNDDILRFTFLWNTNRDNVKDVEAKTSFAKKVKEKALQGKEFFDVLGVKKL